MNIKTCVTRRLSALALAAICALLAAPSASEASTIAYGVSINTSSLPAGSAPYALDFQLLGGSPLGNTVTIDHFDFGGGLATNNPAATTIGLAGGSLGSSVTLSDSGVSFFNEFYQGFTPGATLSFIFVLSTNVNGPTPDAFSIAILDKNLLNIPTGGVGDALLLVNIDKANAFVQTFAGTGAFSGVTVTATALPEPGSLTLLGVGLAGAGARRWRKRRA